MQFQQTASLDFPDADNTLGTTVIDVTPGPVSTLAIAFNAAIPTAGSIVVSILKDGGNPATQADYYMLTSLTAPGIVNLNGLKIRRVRVQGKSGTGTGTVSVTVAAN